MIRTALLCGVLSIVTYPQAAIGADFEVGAASEYVGKGLGKSDGAPSAFGAVSAERGRFYASLWASTAKAFQGGDSEVLTTLGVRPKLGKTKFDFAAVHRTLPGTRPGVDGSWVEWQADAGRSWGSGSARLRANYTDDGYAGTRQAWWTEIQGGWKLDGKSKLTAAVARRTAEGGADYDAWNVGLKRDLTEHATLDLRWFDTDQHRLGPNYDGRLVAALAIKL